MVCALIAAVGLPALASGNDAAPKRAPDARVYAFDFGFHEAGQPDDDNVVNIPVGGTVEFSYPSGDSVHNVDFGQDETTCELGGAAPGDDSAVGPPMPPSTQGPGWVGTCTFAWQGTYHFFCQAHPDMT